MDTELLKTFLEVSKTRHFGQAAETLYLTQSAVSFRIRQLESQLGANLFTRHRNNIRLTPAGERLLPFAEGLINTWQLAKKEVQRSVQQHEISIGAISSLWESYLTSWLQSLYPQHNMLQLEARIALRHSLVKQLYTRELDLLITSTPPKMDALTNHLLGNFSLRLFSVAPRNTSTPMPYIKVEWDTDFHQPEENVNNPPILTTTSAHLARKLLETTASCAFLPEHWNKKYAQLNAVTEIPTVTRPLYAVWLQKSDKLPLIRQLLKTWLNTAL